MSYIENESFKHKLAKELLATWLKEKNTYQQYVEVNISAKVFQLPEPFWYPKFAAFNALTRATPQQPSLRTLKEK